MTAIMQSVNSKGAVGTRPAAPDLFYSVCLLLKLTYVRLSLIHISCSEQVDETLGADIRIQALDQLRTLGCNAPVALAGLAGAAQVAAHCQQSRGADVACVRAERDGLEPVSYTHLDVYKRQPYTNSSLSTLHSEENLSFLKEV